MMLDVGDVTLNLMLDVADKTLSLILGVSDIMMLDVSHIMTLDVSDTTLYLEGRHLLPQLLTEFCVRERPVTCNGPL